MIVISSLGSFELFIRKVCTCVRIFILVLVIYILHYLGFCFASGVCVSSRRMEEAEAKSINGIFPGNIFSYTFASWNSKITWRSIMKCLCFYLIFLFFLSLLFFKLEWTCGIKASTNTQNEKRNLRIFLLSLLVSFVLFLYTKREAGFLCQRT